MPVCLGSWLWTCQEIPAKLSQVPVCVYLVGGYLRHLVCIYINIGGADKNAVVFQKDTEQIVSVLKGHTKKVTCVVYHPREVQA